MVDQPKYMPYQASDSSTTASRPGRSCRDGRARPAPGRPRVDTGRSRQPRRLHPPEGSTRSSCSTVEARHPRRSRPGPRAVQHLLLPLPRPDRRRQRHDRPARVLAAAVVPSRDPRLREAPAGHFFRRHHQRLRGHVLVRLPDPARRPLGDRRLHPGPATEPERPARRPAAGRPREAARGGPVANERDHDAAATAPNPLNDHPARRLARSAAWPAPAPSAWRSGWSGPALRPSTSSRPTSPPTCSGSGSAWGASRS